MCRQFCCFFSSCSEYTTYEMYQKTSSKANSVTACSILISLLCGAVVFRCFCCCFFAFFSKMFFFCCNTSWRAIFSPPPLSLIFKRHKIYLALCKILHTYSRIFGSHCSWQSTEPSCWLSLNSHQIGLIILVKYAFSKVDPHERRTFRYFVALHAATDAIPRHCKVAIICTLYIHYTELY